MRKFGAVGVLALGIALSLWGCGSEKGAEAPVEETHYPTRAACDERGWTQDFGPQYRDGVLLDSCLAFLYHEFIEDSEWDPGYKPYVDRELIYSRVEWRGIRKISPKLKDLYYLETIVVWGSDSLKLLPPELYTPDSLVRVYVNKGLNVSSVSGPKDLVVGKNLRSVLLFRLPRAQIEESFWTLPITTLRLDSMSLTDVPAGVLQMKTLTYLSMEYNQLTTVPREIYGLDSLEMLYVGINAIKEIPYWACERRDVDWTIGMNEICNSADSLWTCIGYSELSMSYSIQRCN